jgi:hypothetical protein
MADKPKDDPHAALLAAEERIALSVEQLAHALEGDRGDVQGILW